MTAEPLPPPASTVAVVVNGSARPVAAGTTVVALVAEITASPRGIAVALNAEVVPRSAWSHTVVADGDEVEVLTAAQGG